MGSLNCKLNFTHHCMAVYKSVLNCIQTARICYHAPRAWWHHLVNVDKLQWLTGTLTLSSYELCDLDLWPFRLINQSWTRVPLCHYRMFLSDSMSPDWFLLIMRKTYTGYAGRRTDGRTDELLVTTVKLLSVYVDVNLSETVHINTIVAKANKNTFLNKLKSARVPSQQLLRSCKPSSSGVCFSSLALAPNHSSWNQYRNELYT